MFRPWETSSVSDPEPANVIEVIEIEDSDEQEELVEEHDKMEYQHLSTDVKKLIKTVHQSLVERNCSAPIRVTSELTKKPYSTVQRIVTSDSVERKQYNRKKFSRISEQLGVEIKQVIYNCYKENYVPTTNNLKEKLISLGFDINYCEETFRQYLRSIGFEYKTLDRRLAIMESLRLKKWRWDYINQIRKFRQEGRYIVYLDETWYDTHDTVKKGLSDGTLNCCLTTPPSRGKRVIILHAGGMDGWSANALLLSAKNISNCSADYHCDMDAALFETWFQQQLIPFLPARSVIVMDNAKYHSKLLIKKPTAATRKDDIIAFMRENNIEVPVGKPTKKDLLQIIKITNVPQVYRIDKIAENHGHEVLRLPPYYCVLNPIELVWSSLKKGIRRNNTSPTLSGKVVDLIRQQVSLITRDLWQECIRHVIDIENSYVSPAAQQFIINVDDNDDSVSDLFPNSDSDDE